VQKKVEIGKNIERYLEYSRKSQADVSREIGVSTSLISEYVKGNNYPSVKTLIKLCVALDCAYEDLLGKPTTENL